MNTRRSVRLEIAELREKEAQQRFESKDLGSAIENWEEAVNIYIQENAIDNAIACLEEAAKKVGTKGEISKSAEWWNKLAHLYIEKRDFTKTITCFENADLLDSKAVLNLLNKFDCKDGHVFNKTIAILAKLNELGNRAIDLISYFEPEAVISALAQKRLRMELALVYLHLKNGEYILPDTSVFEYCYNLANETLKVSKAQSLRLLKGAMLAASWLEDGAALHQAVDLAFSNDLGAFSLRDENKQEQAIVPSDSALLLLIKINTSGEFRLINELSNFTIPSNIDPIRYSPFQLRLLAPIYLYRGIKLDTLLDAMDAIPTLARCVKSYRSLFSGIEAGQPDKALYNFVSTLIDEAKISDARIQLKTWADVERRFQGIVCAQPEYLSAAILWEQIATTRAGVQELYAWIAQAHRDYLSKSWAEVKTLFEQITGYSLLIHLQKPIQAKVYQLGCTAAFKAEDWDQYDLWAMTLEEQYSAEEVLREVVVSISNTVTSEDSSTNVKLQRMAEYFQKKRNPKRAAEAWAELAGAYIEIDEVILAAKSYMLAGDQYRKSGNLYSMQGLAMRELMLYRKAINSYQESASQFAFGGQDSSAREMRQEVGVCEEHIRGLGQIDAIAQVAREIQGAGQSQSLAMKEGSAALEKAIREGFVAASEALLNGLTTLAQAQREAAIESARIIAQGLEQVATSQFEGFYELASAIREGNLIKLLSTYLKAVSSFANLKGAGPKNTEAAKTLRDTIESRIKTISASPQGITPSNTSNILKIFDAMTCMLPAENSLVPGPLPDSLAKQIVDYELDKSSRLSEQPVHLGVSNCVIGSGPPNVVLQIARSGRIYQQCTVAQYAMTRRWHKIDALSAKYLEQGGCPLPKSLGFIQRHFWYKKCELTDGREHDKDKL